MNENRLFEAGLKSTLQFDDREQIFNEFDFGNQEYVLDDWVTNQFSFDEQIHAAYLIYRDRVGRFSYQAGLRGEFTLTESYQPVIDSTYNYNYFLPFPSIFLSYEISQHQDIQASYSRRIRRPRQHSLAPFINAQDFFNLRLGNPYLEPEHTDNFEINYIRAWERYMFTAGVFHRYTTNALTRVFILFDDATMVTWTNADTRNATGVELINYFTWSDNFDATLTGNFFQSEISGEREGVAFSNQSYSWSLSLLGNLNIPRYFSSQITANYQGPRVIPQGQIRPVFSMNLGFRRNVFNQQGTVSLSVSDIFNTRRFSLETNGTGFYQEREFKRESRVATLSFTWRFRGYLDRSRDRGVNGFEGDVEGLF
jgi:outer membrane cobalamin receptor